MFLTLIEEILVEDPSNASLFLSLKESSPTFSLAPFFRILSTEEPDWYLTSKVCHILALLIHKSPQVNHEEAKQLLHWIKSQLSKNDPLDLITPLTTLQTLLRKDDFRILFYNEQGLPSLVSLLKTQMSHFQVLYQTTFCLWLLSYNSAIAQNFGASGAIPSLVNILKTIGKDKVVRMTIATLRNLVEFPSNNEPMVETNLLKEVEKLSQKKWADEDVVNDLQVLTDTLQKSVSELSSWDMYKQELFSGLGLEWSPVHRSERFWRENALHFEDNQNQPLEYLLGHLTDPNSTPTTLAVACHDIGELVRFHPRGRALIQNLGGKQKIMKLMSEHRDTEVQKQALLCLQKLMVQNWEYLTR